jgi:molecular chaperone DnaK (HSP70)
VNEPAQATLPRAIVGIDLGTSHTALAWAACREGANPQSIPVEQWVAGRRRGSPMLLPSVLYAPTEQELPQRSGHAQSEDWIAGEYARIRSQETRGRAIASAKSWLCHSGVDRLGAILPWEGDEAISRLSPVEVSERLLAHVSACFARLHPELDPAELCIVLTVPASFDQTARKLTALAAERAGLRVRLLEEPQAAFHEYLGHSGTELAELVERRGPLSVLVCDVGGGTTDLSLIEVTPSAGSPALRRSAVGRHLLLGGDNMDLALAHLCERKLGRARLAPERFGQLLLAARGAKEALLASDPPESYPIRLLGSGSELVGGSMAVDIASEEARQLVLEGFFPLTTPAEMPDARRSALTTFGLPYERDPAITRHIAEFLARHAAGRFPAALLLNGGVMQSEAIRARLIECFAGWGAQDLTLLRAPDPLLAVSLGAVRYGLSLHGLGPRITGGAAHGYYVAVEKPGAHEARHALCVVPRGSLEGERHLLSQRFELVVGRPARFELYASDTALHAPGAQVEIDAQFQALPPLATELSLPGAGAGSRVQVELDGELSAVGTLDLGCTVVVGSAAGTASGSGAAAPRFALAFELSRATARTAQAPRSKPFALESSRLAAAEESVLRVFGKGRKDVPEREVKDLRSSLERALGPRKEWDLELNRRLCDLLVGNRQARLRSADHERIFWMITGYCLRPGFGHARDPERVRQLWSCFDAGLSHRELERVWQQYWIAWRRIAAGLDPAQQAGIRMLIDPLLAPAELKLKKAKTLRPLALDEVLALASQLERIEARDRSELGRWILDRTWHDRDPRLWAHLGRVGARVPAYASAHYALRGAVVERWVEQLLRERWSDVGTAPACAVQLARVTGDQLRDLSPALRREVATALARAGAPPEWQRAVLELVPITEAERAEQLDEDLPLGLRLISGDLD